MKKSILLILMILEINTVAFSQGNKDNKIYFGAIIGTKLNYFAKHFNVGISPNFHSFSIGAGSAYTKNKYVVGIEFIYSSASKVNSLGEIQYIGFSNTLSVAYNISKTMAWKIEPTVGLVLNNNQLVIQDKTNTTFQNLINNELSTNIGLNIKKVAFNGLFQGLKLGYTLPFSGESEWKTKVSGISTRLNDNVGAFYLQLNVGGLLSLSKKVVNKYKNRE